MTKTRKEVITKEQLKAITKELFEEGLKTLTRKQMCDKFNISTRTFSRLKKKFGLSSYITNHKTNLSIAKEIGDNLEKIHNINKKAEELQDLMTKSQLELMKERETDLKNELKKLHKELALKDEEFQGIWQIKNSYDFTGRGQPDWLTYTSSGNQSLSIPTLFCSDEHWGEVVFKDQVNGVNEYNKDIARKRFNNIYNGYLEVVNDHLKSVDTSKMVLLLGGDNVSGDIHDELTATNDLTTMEAVYDYVDHKIKGIKELLAAGFNNIFVACVTGNHDRLTHKIFGKMRNETSCAYLVYRFIQMAFQGDNRVQFSIASGIDALYQVNNHRMLLTHGDCFKGGNGIGGITIPILRGFLKKQSNYASTGNNFDSMVIGHFHQFTSISNGQVIINGSTKGFDEYSQRMGFSYQDPCQAFWLTHPKRGITVQLPIWAEEQSGKSNTFNTQDWVSWKK